MSSIKHPRWKVALWGIDNVEPAMLRVPIILLIFVFLWGVNMWLFEKTRLPYHGALSIKTANLTTIFSTSIFLFVLYSTIITIADAVGLSIVIGLSIFYTVLTLLIFMPGELGFCCVFIG
jgi:hypothetical protein